MRVISRAIREGAVEMKITKFSRLIKGSVLKITESTELFSSLSRRISDSFRDRSFYTREREGGRGRRKGCESDMDAEKLSKRDTVKRKERGGDARTHARMYARARARKGRERRNKGGRRGGHVRSGRQRERRKDGAREKGEGEKAWCNGGTSLRVSAPHQREALQPLDARTMPPGERRTGTGDPADPAKDVKEEGRARSG